MVPTTPDQTINASNFVKTIISLGVCACLYLHVLDLQPDLPLVFNLQTII